MKDTYLGRFQLLKQVMKVLKKNIKKNRESEFINYLNLRINVNKFIQYELKIKINFQKSKKLNNNNQDIRN